MTEDISIDFIAAGGNRHPSAADWDASGLLAYGADCNVALWQPDSTPTKGVQALLKGHSGIVNAIKFLESPHGTLLLSGATDKSVRLWQKDEHSSAGWKEAALLNEHQSAINAFAVFDGTAYFVSAAAEANVFVWHVETQENKIHVALKQKISLQPHYFPLALDTALLTETNSIVLAIAGTSSKIQIYVSATDVVKFDLAATLSGHEGWIRSLAFVREHSEVGSDFLLASTSQDKYVRSWRLHKGEQLPPANQAGQDPLLGSIGKTLSNRPHRFTTQATKYSVTFEALLVGHEDWVYTARWDRHDGKLRLLTASADSSLSIWELDQTSEVWICSVRLGEISAQKGATTATGSSGGFWIGLWNPLGDAVVSLGRTGAWRLWRHRNEEDAWVQQVAITGHTRDVKSIAWSSDGSYLLSTGSDQTTRLFAEWKRNEWTSWHELSRPQIHGYDLNCIDSLGKGRFVSGADEKLLRVFDEPKGVAHLLSSVTGFREASTSDMPETAQIPVMGLSNKAADGTTAEPHEDHRGIPDDSPIDDPLTEQAKTPPVEDQLGRHLLWPEKEKLYGHGYEICAVAASHNSSLIATACRASSIDHAVIRLFETESWQEVKPSLKAHSLTVTSLAFSPDDAYLLSVGRDRQCCMWTRKEENRNTYEHYAADPKAHSRMILDCAWTPLQDCATFVTAGRDKRVHVWTVREHSLRKSADISFPQPVTALACLQQINDGQITCAAGLEDGSIFIIWLSAETQQNFKQPSGISSAITPSKAVTSLTWRPSKHLQDVNGETSTNEYHAQLAVASEDVSVRILSVPIRSNGPP